MRFLLLALALTACAAESGVVERGNGTYEVSPQDRDQSVFQDNAPYYKVK